MAFKIILRNNIIFSCISYPNLPDKVVKTNTSIYYRLHGVPVLYKSAYSELFLKDLAKQINKLKIKQTWIYFNNTLGNRCDRK